MLLDRIVAFAAIATLMTYLGIFIVAVPRPALIIVTLFVLALVFWDFWSQLFRGEK